MKTSPQQSEIEAWLCALLSELLEMPQAQIDPTVRFDRYGLDSAAAISVAEELGNHLERELDATLLYDHPTIRSLAQHLSSGERRK